MHISKSFSFWLSTVSNKIPSFLQVFLDLNDFRIKKQKKNDCLKLVENKNNFAND